MIYSKLVGSDIIFLMVNGIFNGNDFFMVRLVVAPTNRGGSHCSWEESPSSNV